MQRYDSAGRVYACTPHGAMGKRAVQSGDDRRGGSSSGGRRRNGETEMVQPSDWGTRTESDATMLCVGCEDGMSNQAGQLHTQPA